MPSRTKTPTKIIAALSAALALAALSLLLLASCAPSSNENTVVIYSSAEGMRNETMLSALHERFPDYDIRLHYLATATMPQKSALKEPIRRPISFSPSREATCARSPTPWRS